MFNARPSVLVGLLVLLLSGCGSDRGDVSSTVTFKGEPLDQGRIEFFAKDGPPGPTGGAAIRDGKYALTGNHGLEPGSYTVQIRSSAPQNGVEVKMGDFPVTVERIPPEYNSRSTQIVVVAPRGTNQFDFRIE